MARAPAEEPQGLLYSPDVISAADEKNLLSELRALRWDPIVLHGRTARRSGRHFGFDYDYQARAPHPGDRVPDWLRPARERAARLAGHEPEELVEIRSGYVLAGEVRTLWQHSITPTKELRYSITFRTLLC